MIALSKTRVMEDAGSKGTGAGQRGSAMPKAASSPSNYASGDEDGRELGYVSAGSSNWYGKLKGMSSSLKKLTLSKKKQPSATQGSQSLARALSFNNTSKSVDHGRPSSSSKKELAATNLKGLGSNSVDLSCGIARVPSGGVVSVPKRRNRSLELPREHVARAQDEIPAFSKSKIPIVKSNFVKESKEKKEDSDDPTFGIHMYQRLATASDSEGDDTAGNLRPASTTVEYESSLANLMLMEQLGCDPPLPADSSPQKDEQNAKSTKPAGSVKRLDVIISGPAKEIPAAGGKKEAVAGSGQKPAKEEKSGGSGWPLRRLTGSGPLLSNGRKKGAGSEKKATEIANTGIKGKGGPGKSMSGELFTLKAAKKASADLVVPARKSVSDIPARKSVSKDGPNPSNKKPQPDASAGKRTGSGILPDAAKKQPLASVTKKAGPVSDSPGPGRKSTDLGSRNAGPGRKSVSNKLGSSALNGQGQGEVIRPAGDSVSGQPDKEKIVGSNEDPGSMLEFLKASVDFSAPYVQGAVVSEREKVDSSAGLLHPDSLFDASGSPTSILAGSGAGESVIAAYGERVEQEDGSGVGGDEDFGSGRSPPSGSEFRIVGISREFDGKGGGSLEPTAFTPESPKKSVQDLIRELERNAAQAARAGPARAQKGVTVPIKERAGPVISPESPPRDVEDGAGSGPDGEAASSGLAVEEKRAVSDSEQGPSVSSILAGDSGGDVNSVSMARFESASLTAETPNDTLKAELRERFEELHHKLKIDLDPKVVQDIHRTFNFGLVQAAAVASAGESGTIRSKPAQGIIADGNRRNKLVAPPKALGAAAYNNKIIEGIAGLSVSIAKPAAAARVPQLAIGEVASSAVDKSSSSANPIRDTVPAVEDSEEEELPHPAIDPLPVQPPEQPRSSVESTMDVRVLSSTASTKMLTSRNMDKVAALLKERSDRRAAPQPDPADEASSEVDSARFQDLPRSSIDSDVKALSSTSSNKMLTAKNFQRVAALLHEYNAELKAGLVAQPRTAGGLDSGSSSFSRLDPMLHLDEFESEADHTVTKKVVKPYLVEGSSSKSSPARVASDTYQTSTPPSAKSNGTAASGGSAARRNGPRVVASRYRNVDYSPKVSNLGQSVDAADMRGPWNRGSGSQTARRSLDLQFKAQMSDPYYSKPRNSRSGAAHHSNSNGNGGWSSAQADRGQPKRGRARSPGANSLSRDTGQGGRKAGPVREDSNLMALQAHVQSEAAGANGKQKSRMVAAAMEERVMHEDVKIQKDRFQEKHQLSRPEYIDECNDIIPVWVDGGSVQDKPEAAPRAAAPRAAATSSAATQLRNSRLRPRENLSYNGEALRAAARPKDRRNFSGPLVACRIESGPHMSDEELQESEGEQQWPRSGPVIPASVLRQIYDDREISEEHELVVDRSSLSGVLRDRGPRDSPNGVGGLYFSGPLISETIRKSKIVHSGPPSTGSEQFFDRVSKGKMSRSASIRMRETENPDSGDIPDQVMHEHEYLIQDHEQLYEYLDQYSDQNTFLDQYIADQLQELALQQDLHDILSDQLEKAQAAAAVRAAASASGPSDMSMDSKNNHESDMDSQEGEAASEPERELEVDDGDQRPRTFDSDGRDESPILLSRDASPDQILRFPEEKPISASSGMIIQEPEEDDRGNFPYALKQMEREYESLPAAVQQVSGDKQRSPSSVALSRASLLEAVENDLNGSPGRGGAVSSFWYKLRSPSSKSMGASSLPDTHQDLDMRVGSSQRSTVSSRAKSKLYSSSDSPGGGYDSDRNGAEPSGIRSRFRSTRDFMNSSVQSEPGGMRALLAKSRGMISANSSPAPAGMSSRRRAARSEAGTSGEISTPSRSAHRSRRSFSPAPAATPPSSAAPAENSPVPSSISRTSFPSLYLMQVSQPAPPLTPTGTATAPAPASANRRLRPPSRNLLTQNIATISIDDFKSGSRPASASASTLKQTNPRAQAQGNGGTPRPSSPGPDKPGIQQSKPDLLNTSIQSDPGSKAATLLLNLESQNRLGRGLSKSLNPNQDLQPGDQPAAIPAQPAPESDRVVESSNKQEVGATRDPDPAAEAESASEGDEEEEEGSGSESGSRSESDSSDCALSVGVFRREALRMFGAGACRTDSEQEQEQELLSNLEFETLSLKLESEKGEGAPEISKDLQEMVTAKRGELEKLCAAVPDSPGRDSDFHSAVVDMILEKDDINDLLDLEEFLNGYMCLRPPFQDVVKQFFGDLCQCDLVY